MGIRIFSIPTSGSPKLEEEMNKFMRGHRVLQVEKELVQFEKQRTGLFVFVTDALIRNNNIGFRLLSAQGLAG